ncbi:MAG: PTS sugar transporter subunit IIA [Thermoguttaceae bacterium]
MSNSDFDISRLSKYVHMTEKQVQKLADKGEIPGRKLKGEWVFSKEEVHHWLEHRIGLAGDQELAGVEDVLAKNAVEVETEISIASLIPEGGIEIPFLAKTKDSVIRSITALAINTGLLWDSEKMIEALRKREELHPTALDNGVALLHPRRPMPSILGETFLVLGISPNGVPFGGNFSGLTDIFFLICSEDDRIHLRVLARLSRILARPKFLENLRELSDPAAVRELIQDTEAEVP